MNRDLDTEAGIRAEAMELAIMLAGMVSVDSVIDVFERILPKITPNGMKPGGANLVGMIQADPISIGTTAIAATSNNSTVLVVFRSGSQADTFAQWLLTHYPDAEDLILPF
jgi:hypothetical protein